MIVYALYDEQFTIHAVSGGASVYGFSPDDFSSGNYSLNDIVHHEDFPGVREKITREMDRESKSFEIEYRAITKSGHPVWVTSTVLPEYSKNGTISKFLMEVKDVTTHKLYAAELKEMWLNAQKSQSIMHSVFNYSKDGIAIMDRNGVVLEWSLGYEKITGVSKQEATGKIIWDIATSIIHYEAHTAEEIEKLMDCFELALSGTYPDVITRHIRHQITGEHKIFHVQYFPVPIPDDITVGVVAHDATDEIRSCEKLEQSNELLENIMQAIPLPVYVKNKNDEYLRCNEAFLEEFKLSKEQLVGKTGMEMFPWYCKKVREIEHKLLSNENVQNTRVASYNREMEKIVYRSILRRNGEKDGIVGVMIDVSDLKKAEEEIENYRNNLEKMVKQRTKELAKANRQLKVINKELNLYRTQLEKMVDERTCELLKAKERAEESDRLKSAFLANISHEIRTPLNGMIGFINVLNSGELPPERQKELVKMINSCSRQLTQQIDDILDIAKIEAGQFKITPKSCHVNKLMYETYRAFEKHIRADKRDNLVLILDDSDFVDRCVIYVDQLRLRQVISNLVGNAIKFTQKGYIKFGYRQADNGMYEFVVEDTGIGIESDHLDYIFEQFRKAEKGEESVQRGTGLGLSIAQNLVKLMGGEISVESTVDMGSSFRFTIGNQNVEAK